MVAFEISQLHDMAGASGTRGPILGFYLSPVPQGPRSLDALLGASTARFLSLNTFLPILSEPLLGEGKFHLHSFESFGMQAVTELCHNCEGCRASRESYPPFGAFFFWVEETGAGNNTASGATNLTLWCLLAL